MAAGSARVVMMLAMPLTNIRPDVPGDQRISSWQFDLADMIVRDVLQDLHFVWKIT
jgi:hypothetical protein